MSGYVLTLWRGISSRTNGPVAGASAATLLSTNLIKTVNGSTVASPNTLVDYIWNWLTNKRAGVKICAYAATVYIKYVPFGTPPTGVVTCSASDYDEVIPIGTTLTIGIPKDLDVIIFTSGNFSATEWLG